MKKQFITHALLLAVSMLTAVSAKADAQLTFFSRGGNLVFDVNGTTALDSNFKGQIYAGLSSGSLIAFSPISQFGFVGGSPNPTFNGSIVEGATITLSGVNPGAGFYQLKAWQSSAGSSFEAASLVAGAKVGSSAITAITFGGTPIGGSGIGTPGPNTDTFASFSLTTVAVPEPATLALGLFGAAGLLFRRRK